RALPIRGADQGDRAGQKGGSEVPDAHANSPWPRNITAYTTDNLDFDQRSTVGKRHFGSVDHRRRARGGIPAWEARTTRMSSVLVRNLNEVLRAVAPLLVTV